MPRQLLSFNSNRRSPPANALAILSNSLEKQLDDRYVLIRNAWLKQNQLCLPAVLIGPTGLFMLYASDVQGVFAARGSSWEQLKKRGQSYIKAKPNLIARAKAMAAALDSYLSAKGVEHGSIEPVIFFANPEIHVDTDRPDVRLVMPDTLDRLVRGIQQAQVVYDRVSLQAMIDSLVADPQKTDSTIRNVVRDEFELKEFQKAKTGPLKPFFDLPRDEPALTQKIPFTRRQWYTLILLILANILILTTLVVFVLVGR